MCESGLPVKSLLEYTKLFNSTRDTKNERRTILTEQLIKLENQTKIIDHTINHLQNKIKAYGEGIIK